MANASAILKPLLSELTARARQRGWSDAAWARHAGLPKETLCRLRSRSNCDLNTLAGLADSLGVILSVVEPRPTLTPDGRWPAKVDRAYEAKLLDLAASGSTDPEAWRQTGAPFFLAGLAVTLASVTGFDRPRYLELADALHAGVTEPAVFGRWLAATPLQPARFLPMVMARLRHAA
ncbi:MAG: hypothetical protein JNM50_10680 [Chromatiales bacterium]|jgi:hypothetical protein|nr:hypothetical protein [Chromatiales bacterium]